MSERLRKVAERLGHENLWYMLDIHGEPYKLYWNDGLKNHEFNPHTNPAQLVECIEWLGSKNCELFKDDGYWFVYQNNCWPEGRKQLAHEELLADAVINAIAGEEE
ncbi:MAG: hypothetical protein GWN30_00680 [Gammaproteobacteria bacterium]|nr:hypothetical protein [Gammaproteobacteria bacterium]NIW98622.1 hypothetical protein [Phycisphaerae bacterium]